MLTSANYSRDENVINSGEEIAPEFDLKAPGVKIYRASVPNCRTHLPDGAEIRFRGGMFATANPEIIAFLDKIANRRGSLVYTTTDDMITQELASASEDAAKPAGDAQSFGSVASIEMLTATKSLKPVTTAQK